MKKLLCIILICLLASAVFVGCGNTSNNEESTEVIEETEAPVKTFDIKTKYATLKYPEEWESIVTIQIEEEPYTVKFLCDSTPLFDLIFNGDGEYVIGSIVNGDETIVIRMNQYELNKTEENYDTLNAMCNSVNVIIDHLESDYEFVRDYASEEAHDEVYEIKTKIVSLYYPVIWKDDVTVDVKDTGVYFSYGKVKLFDLLFSSEEGSYLGTYDNTTISVISYDIEKGDLSEKEYTKLLGMQDGLNVILENLQKDKLFRE